MVPFTRRASSCFALALSILLPSLAHLSTSLSCSFFLLLRLSYSIFQRKKIFVAKEFASDNLRLIYLTISIIIQFSASVLVQRGSTAFKVSKDGCGVPSAVRALLAFNAVVPRVT